MKFDLNVKVYDLREIRLFDATLKNFLKKVVLRLYRPESACCGQFTVSDSC
jgi:hypothetical protein